MLDGEQFPANTGGERMTQALSVHYDVSADGRTVAEAEVDDFASARELIAAATAGGCELVWAHSAADLSSLGFAGQPGYRRLIGWARPAPLPEGVIELAGDEDTAELCAAAYHGQWGHKTPDTWPIEEFAATGSLSASAGSFRRLPRSTLQVCSRASAIRPATGCSSLPRCRRSRLER
jgi:hypothetical protein